MSYNVRKDGMKFDHMKSRVFYRYIVKRLHLYMSKLEKERFKWMSAEYYLRNRFSFRVMCMLTHRHAVMSIGQVI